MIPVFEPTLIFDFAVEIQSSEPVSPAPNGQLTLPATDLTITSLDLTNSNSESDLQSTAPVKVGLPTELVPTVTSSVRVDPTLPTNSVPVLCPVAATSGSIEVEPQLLRPHVDKAVNSSSTASWENLVKGSLR